MIWQAITDPDFLAMMLAVVAAIATVYTVAMPLLLNDSLEKRMKAVALERDQIRTREREAPRPAGARFVCVSVRARRSAASWTGSSSPTGSERKTPSASWCKPAFAGKRPNTPFLVFRLVMPIGFLVFATFYLFVVEDFGLGALPAHRDRDSGRLYRHQGPGALSTQCHRQTPRLDQAGLAGCP